ncbi:hypothetical protein IGI04_024905 [Brassica rapa subsp. trilocularis]|uniref:Protein kinase domain-containing protein n=1 Tax=Brassica rapa subsp. trilocularis TaxID=1813537 RepID=A0ABQ7M817_BRACM|nr:hypothetical protein IGI04_024905 [Brassica rapa subsp. trilocularis]
MQQDFIQTKMVQRKREVRESYALACSSLFFFIALLCSSSAELTDKGVNYEVLALIGIKSSLIDPHGVLMNWDDTAVDPCSWNMITCSADGFVLSLGAPSQDLSGTLSSSIGNLTYLQTVLLQNNYITGHIPPEIGKLMKLKTLDLSTNNFTGQIPSTLSASTNLQYLRMNHNSLTGTIPSSLANMTQLTFLDLSYNNLSGPVPRSHAKTFNVMGNPQICPTGTEKDCNGTQPKPTIINLNNEASDGGTKNRKIAIAFGAGLTCICLLIIAFGFLIWWRRRHNQQIFFDVNDQNKEEVCLGNLRRFSFKELQSATSNFSSKNLVGKGGFGNVYKGRLHDGTIVAVKRLKDVNNGGGEIQFQTEVEMISLAVHRNLLRLYGLCTTSMERLLVYPYMSNGSVKKLQQEKNLEQIIDKDLERNYDRIEVEEIVKVALLCTQYLPIHRPKMSEVVRMLEGDGLVEKWEASSQRTETNRSYSKPNEFSSSERYSDLTDDSSVLVQAMELSGPR